MQTICNILQSFRKFSKVFEITALGLEGQYIPVLGLAISGVHSASRILLRALYTSLFTVDYPLYSRMSFPNLHASCCIRGPRSFTLSNYHLLRKVTMLLPHVPRIEVVASATAVMKMQQNSIDCKFKLQRQEGMMNIRNIFTPKTRNLLLPDYHLLRKLSTITILLPYAERIKVVASIRACIVAIRPWAWLFNLVSPLVVLVHDFISGTALSDFSMYNLGEGEKVGLHHDIPSLRYRWSLWRSRLRNQSEVWQDLLEIC
jgi:hypothetical protein